MIERHILPGMGVNCYVYHDEESKKGFIVDPGMASEKVRDYIAEKEIIIEGILLTHGHGDHIMGVEYFRKLYSCPVYAHEDERDILEKAELNQSKALFGTAVEIMDVNYLSSGQVLDIAGTQVKVLHTPGHTLGGVSYLLDEGVFTGDTLFKLGIGRYDLYGGDLAALENSIMNVLYKLDGDMPIYPGHGVLSTIGYERERNPHFRV